MCVHTRLQRQIKQSESLTLLLNLGDMWSNFHSWVNTWMVFVVISSRTEERCSALVIRWNSFPPSDTLKTEKQEMNLLLGNCLKKIVLIWRWRGRSLWDWRRLSESLHTPVPQIEEDSSWILLFFSCLWNHPVSFQAPAGLNITRCYHIQRILGLLNWVCLSVSLF